MRKWICFILLAAGIFAGACRTQKTGCKVPKKNMGAERVMDEMNAPKKKGLFRRG